MLNWRTWRYVQNDEEFLHMYGPEAEPPADDFPLAVYQLDDDCFITMTEEEAFRLFFSLGADYD